MPRRGRIADVVDAWQRGDIGGDDLSRGEPSSAHGVDAAPLTPKADPFVGGGRLSGDDPPSTPAVDTPGSVSSALRAGTTSVGISTRSHARSSGPHTTLGSVEAETRPGDVSPEGVSSQQPSKRRAEYHGFKLMKMTDNGKKKIKIYFEKGKPDLIRPVCKGSRQFANWLGRVVRETTGTPLRNFESFTYAEIQTMLAKVKSFFDLVGGVADMPRHLAYCISTWHSRLTDWRSKTKSKYEAWLKKDEASRTVPTPFSEQQWADLISHYESPEHKEWSEKNKANRAKSKVKHTTGSTSFAEFEFGLSTCDDEGSVQWPEPGDVWLLEHTRPGTDEGERVWADDVSQQIHEKIVTIEAELSASGSSPGDPVYPTDVVLRQHHNRRVGRGSGFAPLVSRHSVTALERERERDHLTSLIEKEAEARQRAEEQLEDLRRKHEEYERRPEEDRRKADEDRRRADEYQRRTEERFLQLMARFTPTE